jgi:hypothetical protein
MSTESPVRRVLGGAVRAFDITLRVIVNLVALFVILFLIALFTRGERPAPIGEGIAVLFDPAGLVVEEYDATPLDRAIARMKRRDIHQVLLR